MYPGILHEITPLNEHDFMYVADRHKEEFTYPIHCHEIMELNFVENAAGCRRIVGDSIEVIGDYDLVLITSSDLEHVWEQHECKSRDIHEVTIQFRLNLEEKNSPIRTNPFRSVYEMMMRARYGLSFSRQAIMKVYPRLMAISSQQEGFYAVQELFSILYELSKFDDACQLSSSSFAKVNVESESRRVQKVKSYIAAHYVEELRVPQLADMVGMAPTAFSRFFRQRTGKSLTEYVIDIRLGFAARRLVDTTESVAEICYACGFNTISNFNRLFRKRKGCSPMEFRQRYCKTKVIV
ncbi:MAG: AraC family transcriptional regulator [Bacteroidaceae bacterium]|nr:AraC family transcriptional regulator [Bacteroidaceae bacterium]